MSITTKEIAELCGVSRGTVDRALNNRPGISEETRKLIKETAEKLGYRPHLLARSLVKGSTMTFGVVLFDLYNRFFAQLYNSIETSARDAGYFTYLTLTGKDKSIEKECIEHLADRQIDGLILCSVNEGPEYEGYLEKLKIPVVTVSNRVTNQFPFVGIDDYRAMQDAVLYIAAKGYQRVIYVSPPLAYLGKSNIYAQHQRFNGFIKALEIYPQVEPVVISEKDYISVLGKMDIKTSRKTAILCSSDIFALEVLYHLKAWGMQVPDNIGLMGFDNIDLIRYIDPSLATVSYPLEDMGTKAVECLVSMLGNKDTTGDIILNHTIIEGRSL